MNGEAEMAELAARSLAVHRVPGAAVAVVAGQRTAWTAGYGVRACGASARMLPTTLVQGGSLAKLITSIGVMRLVEQGALDLDGDVNRYLRRWQIPSAAGPRPAVPLRALLGHTSGAAGGGFPGYEPGAPLPTLPEILAGRPPANSPPVQITGAPGTFRYSGGGALIVQLVLEDRTGQPFGELMDQLVFTPLGLRDTTFAQPLPRSRWEDAAIGHDTGGTPLPYRWPVHPEQAAAGVWTTAGDLALVLRDLQRTWTDDAGRLLRRPTLRAMTKRQGDGPVGLGLWPKGRGPRRRLVHSGDVRGYACCVVAYLQHGAGAVVLTNGANGAAVCTELIDAVARSYGWPSPAF